MNVKNCNWFSINISTLIKFPTTKDLCFELKIAFENYLLLLIDR